MVAEQLTAIGHSSEREGPRQSIEVIVASRNPVRNNFIGYCLPNAKVTALSGGPETDTESEVEIANHKVDFVLGGETANNLGSPFLVIAADARKRIITSNGLQEKGKPASEGEIRQTFSDLLEGSQATGTSPFFVISSGSSAIFVSDDESKRIQGEDIVRVTLRQDRLGQLTDDTGFREYVDTFYSNRFPKVDEQDLPLDIMLSTGGLDFVTLLRIGAVESVDGVPAANTPGFREAVRKALYTSHAGFSDNVLLALGLSNDEIQEKIRQWPWLSELVESIFKPKQNPKLSIVVPVKDDDYILNLFKSLEHCEGFEETELIIARNTDATEEVIGMTDEFARRYANTTVIDVPVNGLGIKTARNAGHRQAHGNWVVQLDSDVTVDPSYLILLKETIDNNPDAEITVTKLLRDPGNNIFTRLTAAHFAELTKRVKPPVHTPGLALKKSAFEGRDPFDVPDPLEHSEDSYLAHTHGNSMHVVYNRSATVTHRADSVAKTVRQLRRYGGGKAIFSRSLPADVRRDIVRQKAKEATFVWRTWEYRNLGLVMAAYEGLIGLFAAEGFWSQELKTMLNGLAKKKE